MPFAGNMPMHAFDDLLHAGLEVIERTDIHLAGTTFAEIGEPQAAMSVEHEIIRAAQRMLAASSNDRLDLAALQVDALDRAAEIILAAARPA